MKGIGIDIIEIDRIKHAVETYGQRFLQKIYTPHEIKYCTSQYGYLFSKLAARFTAKEAYSKAIGTGILGLGSDSAKLNWTDIEVVNNEAGKPFISKAGKRLEHVELSLSHSRDYAVATVYVEK